MCISGNMNYKAEIKNTVWLIGLQGINYLIPLIVWPYLMVVLGAEQWGKFTFGLSLAQWLILIVDFGFNMTATKRISLAHTDKAEISRIFTSTLCAKLLLLAICGVIVSGLWFIPRFEVYRQVMLVFFLMVIGSVFYFVWLYQGLDQIWRVSAINAASKLLLLPMLFLFVKSPSDVLTASFLQAGGFLLCGLGVILSVHIHDYAHLTKIGWRDIRETLHDGFPVFLSSAATSIYTALFVVILAYFVAPDDVGRYTASEKLMRCGILLLWSPVVQAFFPRLSRMSSENRQKAEGLLNKLLLYTVAVSIFFGGILFFAAGSLADFLGSDYEGIQSLCRIMAFVPIFVCVGGIYGQLGLLAMGDEADKRGFRNVYMGAAIFALCIVFPLSRYMGGLGVAIAVLLTEAVVCICIGGLYLKNKSKR